MPAPHTLVSALLLLPFVTLADEAKKSKEAPQQPAAFINGTGPGWTQLTGKDFTKVNCPDATWTWKENGELHCTGKPLGVIRSNEEITNFELVLEWKHLSNGGNSGVFAWTSPASIKNLEKGGGPLPAGIEFQVLDLGYGKADWFTCHGDIFPCAGSSMKPFPPSKGQRSFPSKELTKPFGNWNHYYIRAINGEVRLWVNGEEVSGGSDCKPATGYLCLESEGAPIIYRNIKIRKLP